MYKQSIDNLDSDTFQATIVDGVDDTIFIVNMNIYNNKPTLTTALTMASGYSVDAIFLTSTHSFTEANVPSAITAAATIH